MKEPIWYTKTESFLQPYQGLVTILLLFIIGFTFYMLITPSSTARTAWVTYMFMP